MDYNEFLAAVKKDELKRAYLFTGKEEFVKDRMLEHLLNTLDSAMRDLNVQDAPADDPAALRAACDALPFFAKRRIVLCRELPKEDAGKKVIAYLPEIPESTVLVFFVRGDANSKNGIYKALDKLGALIKFDTLSESEAAKWAVASAKKQKVVLNVAEARHLIALTGRSMATVNNELNKAVGYVGAGGVITREVLNTCVTRNLEYQIFALMQYFTSGNTGEGLRVLDAMLRSGESAMGIASFLAGRFRLMLQAKLLMQSGLRRDAVLSKMGGNRGAAEYALRDASKYSLEALTGLTKALTEVGYQQVSGQMDDRRALELALTEYLPARR